MDIPSPRYSDSRLDGEPAPSPNPADMHAHTTCPHPHANTWDQPCFTTCYDWLWGEATHPAQTPGTLSVFTSFNDGFHRAVFF